VASNCPNLKVWGFLHPLAKFMDRWKECGILEAELHVALYFHRRKIVFQSFKKIWFFFWDSHWCMVQMVQNLNANWFLLKAAQNWRNLIKLGVLKYVLFTIKFVRIFHFCVA
jgi:GR25 family glycosyltransferase involved in LPS biosynthesis